MSQANYYLSLLAQLEAVEASNFITKEEVSVLAEDVLRDLRPALLSKAYENTRAVVVTKLKSLIIPTKVVIDESNPSVVPGNSAKDETVPQEPGEPGQGDKLETKDTTAGDVNLLVSARPAVRGNRKNKVNRKH